MQQTGISLPVPLTISHTNWSTKTDGAPKISQTVLVHWPLVTFLNILTNLWLAVWLVAVTNQLSASQLHFRICHVKKVKLAHTWLPSVGFRSWFWFLAVSLQVTWVINLAAGCHYFPPGPQLLSQPLKRLLPISLLGEQRHDGCEQFA